MIPVVAPGEDARSVISQVVPRPRLLRRLDAVAPGGVAAVVASAGSGKSVLVSQWAASVDGSLVCTIGLQPAHNDATRLAAALLSALQAGGVELHGVSAELIEVGGGSLGPTFVQRLLTELEHAPGDVVIVLDDLHLLTNPAVLDELAQLLSALPRNVRLVLTARWDPPLGLRRLRMQRRLVELRAQDLAFDDREGTELLRQVSGQPVQDGHARTLVDRTDGWAAGLQLAAISLGATDDHSTFVDSFAGTDHLVVEYLTAEVLDTLDPPTRDFLLSTSVLAWFDGALADELTGRTDSHRRIEQLQQRSLFVVPAGSGRVRYHHLFGDLLRYNLRAERGPEAAPALRRRAAAWYLREGHTEEGVEQLLAVRDAEAAWRAVHSVGRRFFELGRLGPLVEWLTRIEEIQATPTPEVQIDLLAAQCAANQFVLAARTHERLLRRQDLRPGQRVAAATLGSLLGLDRLSPELVRASTRQVLDVLPTVEPDDVADFLGVGGVHSVEVMASFMSGIGHLHGGDVVGATEVLDRLVDLPGAQYPVWRVHLLGARALARLWSGHVRSAEALARASIEAAAEAGLSQHMASTAAHSVLAGVSLDRRDVARAAQQLREFEVRALRHRGATFTELHRLQVARLTGFVEGPVAALAELDRSTVQPSTSSLLDSAEQVLRVRLLIESGELEAARSAVIEAGDVRGGAVVRVDVELARGDVEAARGELDRWSPGPGELADEVAHLLRTTAVLRAEGRDDAAAQHWGGALVRAQHEDLRRPFLEQPDLVRALRATGPTVAQHFVASLLESMRTDDARRSGQDRLVEALTERELALLDLLPTRLSNRELATQLYVSVNTVKTHLRNIYRKLDVSDRDAAVARATELGLL